MLLSVIDGSATSTLPQRITAALLKKSALSHLIVVLSRHARVLRDGPDLVHRLADGAACFCGNQKASVMRGQGRIGVSRFTLHFCNESGVVKDPTRHLTMRVN